MRPILALLPNPKDAGLFAVLVVALLAVMLAGCANLSAEQNARDAIEAERVIYKDSPDSLSTDAEQSRSATIQNLRSTAGSATDEAALHMQEAYGWWSTHRRPLNKHLETARERFWQEARKTAAQAALHGK